ncbi:MAG: N-acetylmuramoyl-L-alanine amidase, partial [Phycisphaerae bacterium]|nr:N-acetylmuramoyl-L-alanine amidase [Phycisphaerae bacterium]
TIVLDPGHGMSDGRSVQEDPTYKRGPTGVREDDINLRVALLLERLLRDAGANVILTRDKDMLLGLQERAEIANKAPRPDGSAGADLFISIHHNAVNNRTANYTSVWYHGEVDDAEAALDAGRYIAHRLGAALRTDVGRTSPLLSDQLMYPGGFGVLRACHVPGILLECSFYTHPEEEQRLRDAGYNLRAAYAIYEGLCEWAYGGRPTQTTPALQFNKAAGNALDLSCVLSEALPAWWGSERNRILSSTIRVTADGKLIPHHFDPTTRRLTATIPVPPRGKPGEVIPIELEIRFANMFKHHNHPQRYRIEVQPRDWTVTITAQRVKQARAAATQPQTRPSTTAQDRPTTTSAD